MCETKPNLGGLGHVGKGGRRVRDGFAGKWNVQNEANCPTRGTEAVSQLRIADCGLGKDRPGVLPLRPVRCEMRKTNPICRVPRSGGPHESCETKPIRPRCPEMGARRLARGLYRIDCAKRTQFRQAGRRAT